MMPDEKIADLIERVERLEGPDRELDCGVRFDERERVVAWLDALSQEAKQKRSVDRRAFLEGLAIMIQRGDHSSAKPAGCR